MEPLNLTQAREAKEAFLAQDLPAELVQALGGVGICGNGENIFNVVINLKTEYDKEAILDHFPADLRDNVKIEVIGEIKSRKRI